MKILLTLWLLLLGLGPSAGIKERRILKGDNKGTSFLAIQAAKDLIQKNNLDPTTIDLVVVATCLFHNRLSNTLVATLSIE